MERCRYIVYTGVLRGRNGRLHQARRVRRMGGDAAYRVPDVELAIVSLRDADGHAVDGHAEVLRAVLTITGGGNLGACGTWVPSTRPHGPPCTVRWCKLLKELRN